jgi:hypothetical protein
MKAPCLLVLLLWGCSGTSVNLKVDALKDAPIELCPQTRTSEESDTSTTQGTASARRDRDWIVIATGKTKENGARELSVRYFDARNPPPSPIALGCDKALLLEPNRTARPAKTPSPANVCAKLEGRLIPLSNEDVTLFDMREDWEGGSGGTLLMARLLPATLRLTETSVSRGANSSELRTTTVTEYDRSGIAHEEVQTPAGLLVLHTQHPDRACSE